MRSASRAASTPILSLSVRESSPAVGLPLWPRVLAANIAGDQSKGHDRKFEKWVYRQVPFLGKMKVTESMYYLQILTHIYKQKKANE